MGCSGCGHHYNRPLPRPHGISKSFGSLRKARAARKVVGVGRNRTPLGASQTSAPKSNEGTSSTDVTSGETTSAVTSKEE